MSAAGSGGEETGRARRTERASTGALVPGTAVGHPRPGRHLAPKALQGGLDPQEERRSPRFPPARAQLTSFIRTGCS